MEASELHFFVFPQELGTAMYRSFIRTRNKAVNEDRTSQSHASRARSTTEESKGGKKWCVPLKVGQQKV